MPFDAEEPRDKRGKWSAQDRAALKQKLEKAALVAGITVAGVAAGAVVVGAAARAAMSAGRPLGEGESTLGKVVYTHQDALTPLGLTGHDRGLNKAARTSKVASLAARCNEALGLPRRHYGIGVGGGRIVERMNRRGVRAVSTRDFARGEKIMVESTVPVKTDAQIEAFNKRYEAISARPNMGKIDPLTDNCEHTAREIAGQGRYSRQAQTLGAAVLGGVALGGMAGGFTAAKLARHIHRRIRRARG